jgi:hypothetical protein
MDIPSRKKQKIQDTTTAITGQTIHQVEQDGYGLHMTPTIHHTYLQYLTEVSGIQQLLQTLTITIPIHVFLDRK